MEAREGVTHDRAHDLVLAARALAQAATDIAMVAGVLHETPDATKVKDMVARASEGVQRAMLLVGEETAVGERDRWIRLFNRLDAAITHHQNATTHDIMGPDQGDEALYAARAKVIADAADGEG